MTLLTTSINILWLISPMLFSFYPELKNKTTLHGVEKKYNKTMVVNINLMLSFKHSGRKLGVRGYHLANFMFCKLYILEWNDRKVGKLYMLNENSQQVFYVKNSV